MFRYLFLLIPLTFYLLIDLYAFQSFRAAIPVRAAHWAYWVISFLVLTSFSYALAVDFRTWSNPYKTYISGLFIITLVPKFILVFFSASDDLLRIGKLLVRLVQSQFQTSDTADNITHNVITRSEFLSRLGLMAAAIPFGAMLWGMLRNAYNYHISQQTLPIANLPNELEGLRIVQISDIHTGSFTAKRPLLKAISIIADLKPDMVFFTGDLVNYRAVEAQPYIDIFKRVTAPLGVFAVMGNHDYGDYFDWPSKEAKAENNSIFMEIHRQLGWDLLRNEHRMVEKNGRKIAVIGVENWSAHRGFSRYGDLSKAYNGCQDCDVKLLLSHDPSHWRAEVLPQYPDINATFSGHTHGLQFGVNFAGFKWSPVKYSYKEWYGLYQDKQQYLYVNPGFGFVAYPGRVGFLPEITVFTLQKA